MELKSTVSAVFLVVLLLASPRISRGSSAAQDTEVYPMDYPGRGAHHSIPSPDGGPFIPRQSAHGETEGNVKANKING